MDNNDRIERLERLIPKLGANKRILPLKIECMEWELRALKAERLVTSGSPSVIGRSEQFTCDCGFVTDDSFKWSVHPLKCPLSKD